MENPFRVETIRRENRAEAFVTVTADDNSARHSVVHNDELAGRAPLSVGGRVPVFLDSHAIFAR
jgi:hypothetical protein